MIKKLAFGALFAGLLAACGGGDDGITLVDADTSGPDASQACNPVAQTGCGADEKCTWINIDSMNDVGTLGCVPDGDVATTGACAYGPDGETTGYDNCQGGNICIYSQCEEICNDSPDTCPNTSSCSSYAGLFPDTSSYGACDFLCDPVDQTRDTDNAPACGTSGDGIQRACYANNDDTFSCTGVPGPAADLQQGDTAYGPASGGAYVNGCAAGFAPLLRAANDASAPVICLAFCRPQETYLGNTGGLDGDAASGFTCNARQAVDGHECRFYWFTMAAGTESTDQNDVGFCFKPANYEGDLDMDTTTPDEPFPSCATLANTDTDNSMQPDHLEWACAPYPAAATGVPLKAHKAPFRALTEDELRHFQK